MQKPVVILGAGPSGMSCARRLLEGGRTVVLIDDNAQTGGQYFRQLPRSYSAVAGAKLLRDRERYLALQGGLSHPNLRYLPRTTAWSFPAPLTVSYGNSEESGRIEASDIVIATGAQERSMPFPGWTLPGVISAGGCLNLAKAHGLVPEGKVVVAGNGPLVLVAAATMAYAGAHVTHVVEAQTSLKLTTAALSGALLAPKILKTAIKYRAQILKSRAAYKAGWMVCEAHGKTELEAVTLAPVGAEGRPMLERSRRVEADLLVLGYGILPGSEAARLIGCEMMQAPDLGGLVPKRNAKLQTSLPHVYAIGDGAGIGGVETALLEGEIAAASILGKTPEKTVEKSYGAIDRFRRKLNLAYRIEGGLSAATDQTIICRCEELRLGDLKQDANAKRNNLNALKTSSRLGMGRCQGRNCLHSMAGLLHLPSEITQTTTPRTRAPLRPVPAAWLAADRDAGPAREPDEINLSEMKD